MNVPNALAGIRLLASPGLLVLAFLGQDVPFLALFLLLEATDWLDGKLAGLLDQRSTLGARLDTVADLAMYAALVAGLAVLEGEVFFREWPWMAPALAGYVVSWSSSLVKFRRIPSYHAWSAKVSWLLALLATVSLLTLGDVVLLRVAAVTVALANVEATAITLLIDTPRADVASVLTLVEGEGGSPPSRRS